MINTLGYDFRDTFVEFQGLSLAIRLSTDKNLYAPDPAHTRVARDGDTLTLQADGLIWAGGQHTCEGTLTLTLAALADGGLRATGRAAHGCEQCLTIVLLVRGIPIRALVGESANMPAFPLTREEDTQILSWPGRLATMPLVFAECGDAPAYYALSRDARVRRKAFAAYWDVLADAPTLVLAHDEDARERGKAMELPAWEIGPTRDRAEIVARRLSDLETNFGLRPFTAHAERRWVDDIRLVVNLHGVHWTGHVFMTYAEQAEALRSLVKSIPGKQILAFLPAWEGRYYRYAPVYAPAEELGGAAGLRALIDTAHALGVRVIPMLDGPNLATDEYLRINGLMDAVMRDSFGDRQPQSWVDWNADLSREKCGWIVNFGHPGYLARMVEQSCVLLEEWGFDGIFLDGAIRWENCADYSPYEGLKAWAEGVHAKHPEALLMGEDGYDLLWDIFGLFAASMQPLALEQAMLRYTRQTYYLAYPAPGGSGGVHEQAWHSPTDNGLLREYILPTLALTGDTLAAHPREVAAALAYASAWTRRKSAFEEGEARALLTTGT